MAQTWGEHARLMTDRLERGITKSWLTHFPFMSELTKVNKPGLTTEWLVEQELPTVGWRSINEAFLESTGKTERRQTGMGLVGGLIDIDRRLLKDPTRVDEAATQMDMKVRAIGYEIAYQLINGSLATDPETFDGLSRLATELDTRNSRQIIDASGLDLTTGAMLESNGDTLLDDIFKLIDYVEEGTGSKPSFLLMSSNMKRALRSVARRLGYLKDTMDSFDRRVDSFDGIPLYTSGWRVQASTATEILGDNFDANGYTSIFAVKSGEEYTHVIQQGDMLKEHIGLTENGVWDRWLVEAALGLKATDNFSIARLKGLDITV